MKVQTRNGLRTNLRARGRTALFFLLIFALTLILISALGVRLYCDGVIRDCAAAYRSIAVVEYMGSEYPDADVADPFARAAAESVDDAAIRALPGVRGWTRDVSVLGYAEGYDLLPSEPPRVSYAVIRIRGVAKTEYGNEFHYDEKTGEESVVSVPRFYISRMQGSLYSTVKKENVLINVFPGDSGFVPDTNASYVLHGAFLESGHGGLNGLLNFEVLSFETCDDTPYALCTDDSVPQIFSDMAERYRCINHALTVRFCADLADEEAFHQREVYLSEGRLPQVGEDGVCVVSGDVAETIGLHIGDTLPMRWLYSSAQDRYDITEDGSSARLTVVGITAKGNTVASVWISGTAPNAPMFGYRIGTASLENTLAADTVEEMEAMFASPIRVTLLDQGYSDTVAPFASMRATATDIFSVAAIAAVGVLILFALLFVGRQASTVTLLTALGTSHRDIARWMLAGTTLISGSAVILGAVAGSLLLPVIFRWINAFVASAERVMYSETSIGVVEEPHFSASVSPLPVILCAVFLFAISLVFCAIFLFSVFSQERPRGGRVHTRIPAGKTSCVGSGSPRFALLSLRRSGMRSWLVVLVSLILTVLIVVLCGYVGSLRSSLSDASRDTEIEGKAVSYNGRYDSGLVVPLTQVRQIGAQKDVTNVLVSARWHYYFNDEVPPFGGGAFAHEHFQEWIGQQPEVVAVNGLKGAKEFYYIDPEVTWLDGWSEACLSDPSYPQVFREPQRVKYSGGGYESTVEPYPVVVSDVFAQSHGFSAGDLFTCSVSMDFGYPATYIPLFQIVGIYRQTGIRAHIYVPLAFYVSPDFLSADTELPTNSQSFYGMSTEDFFNRLTLSSTFSTCRFSVTSAAVLDDVRAAFSEVGFSGPGNRSRIRTALMLRDASYLKLKEHLQRYLTVGAVLTGVIFAVIALLGFVLSWLMINGRKSEFALMRGFGAPKGRVFRSFFFEQAALCCFGCLLGCGVLPFVPFGAGMSFAAIGGYLICYLCGAALSVRLTGKTDLMKLLGSKE